MGGLLVGLGTRSRNGRPEAPNSSDLHANSYLICRAAPCLSALWRRPRRTCGNRAPCPGRTPSRTQDPCSLRSYWRTIETRAPGRSPSSVVRIDSGASAGVRVRWHGTAMSPSRPACVHVKIFRVYHGAMARNMQRMPCERPRRGTSRAGRYPWWLSSYGQMSNGDSPSPVRLRGELDGGHLLLTFMGMLSVRDPPSPWRPALLVPPSGQREKRGLYRRICPPAHISTGASPVAPPRCHLSICIRRSSGSKKIRSCFLSSPASPGKVLRGSTVKVPPAMHHSAGAPPRGRWRNRVGSRRFVRGGAMT